MGYVRLSHITSVALLVSALQAENWPMWRGPSGISVSGETELPTKWNSNENVAWKVPINGLGVSSPIVWGDRIFVTSQIGDSPLKPGRHPALVRGPEASRQDRPLAGRRPTAKSEKIELVVTAFRRSDGRTFWEYRQDAVAPLSEVHHEKHNLATPSPVTDGERVYAWFGNGQLVALDMNGKAVWTRHIGREYAVFDLDWGHSSSPVLYQDKLIVLSFQETSAHLLAFDKRSGKEVWRVVREKGLKSYSTPLVVETPKGTELIVNASERVEAYSPDTGRLLWQVDDPIRDPISTPAYDAGVLYLSRGYRSSPFLAVRAGGSGDVSKTHVLWRVPTGAPYLSSLVYYDGLVYMATEMGIVTAVDAKTGQVVWRERLGGLYSASPVAADGKIYLVGETGETLVLRAGRKAEVLARNDLGEQCIASPAISNGQLFIRTDRSLIAIRDASN